MGVRSSVPKGGPKEGRSRLSSEGCSEEASGSGHKLKQGIFFRYKGGKEREKYDGLKDFTVYF